MHLPNNLSLKNISDLNANRNSEAAASLHEFEFVSLEGENTKLGKYKGRYMLLVNVASKCGFTSQYRALQQLSETFGDELVVIGFPCNQFGHQEPGSSEEIKNFCSMRYGVSFPLSEKIKVKGPNQHPVYQWLTKKELNGKKNSTVHWNFQKYLIDPEGQLVDVFYSTTSPISKKITKKLNTRSRS